MAKNVIQSTILSINGGVSVAPGASIEIRNAASGQLVPLWLDRDGTQPTSNPFTTDSSGFFRVYADAGRYHITASKDGQSQEWRDVLLGSPIGVGQTWQNVTSQRAWNTIYTNTTGSPIAVHISTIHVVDAQANISINIGGVIFSGPGIGGFPGLGRSTSIFSIIPPGAEYSASSDRELLRWAELR